MKKPVLFLSHLLYWVFTYLTAPFLFTIIWLATASILRPDGKHGVVHIETAYTLTFLVLGTGACIFYASYFSLMFFLKRPLRFLGVVAVYVILSLVISLPAELVSNSTLMVLGPVLYFNLSGFLFKACVEWLKDRKIKAELEKDKLASQLELLKAKIEPHFLFNHLNNIDVFIQEDPYLASDYLKKLSGILRFMLYESNIEKIPLSKEIEYIQKYIDLQKIRTNNHHFVKLEINGDVNNKSISPMILIHFIENAFKYATNKKIEYAINIKFDITPGHLSFSCKNHVNPAKDTVTEKNGLGIPLLRQKLDLLYKKDYTLLTKNETDWYLVTLDIKLDEN